MASNAIPNSPASGVFSTVGDLQAASWIRNGSVVSVRTSKLDYYIEETQDAGGLPVAGTSPQLYANPQQTTPGIGETNTASNIGVGEGSFAQKVAADLQFHSQINQYGIESNLIGDTYYRGLNPFVADNAGAFVGDMSFSRASAELGVNRSGVVESAVADLPFYGSKGLGCFSSYTHLITKNTDLTDVTWQTSSVTVSPSVEPDPELGNGFFEVENTSSIVGYLRKVIPISAVENKPSASCYFKDRNSGFCGIRLSLSGGNVTFGSVTYDFSTGLISTVGGVSGRAEKLTNGTVRLFCYINNDGANTIADVRFYACDPSGNNPVTSGDSVLLWLPCFTDEKSPILPPSKTDLSQITIPSSSSSFTGNGNLPSKNEDFMLIITTSIPTDGENRTAMINGNSSKGMYLKRRDSGAIECRLGNGESFSNLTKSGVDEDYHRFTVLYRSGEFKLFIDGILEDSASSVSHLTDVSDLIRVGDQLNSYLKIEKWLIGSTYTDQQIADLGGPENAIL